MEKSKSKKLIVIVGPTATGKTKVAVALARQYNGEIISADSRQVFKGMDLGTGKDLAEYGPQVASGASKVASRGSKLGPTMTAGVPYHLIDIIRPMSEFSVAKYQKLANQAIVAVQKKGKLPFMVGGTGLYVDAVIKGYEFAQVASNKSKVESVRKKLDKLTLAQLLKKLKQIDLATYNKIDQKNRRRVQRALEIYHETGKTKSETEKQNPPNYDILVIGIKFPLEKIYAKIDKRLDERLDDGMIKEIKKLHREGVSWQRLDDFGLEYRFVSRYLRGLIDQDQMHEQLKQAIHHFAKRQLTWFNRNQDIKWVKNEAQADKLIKKFLK